MKNHLELYGEIASHGRGEGIAVIIEPFSYYISEELIFDSELRREELKKFHHYLRTTINKIKTTQSELPESLRDLLEIQIHFLRDPIFIDAVEKKILNEGKNVALAVYQGSLELKKFFHEQAPVLIQQRWIDLQDAIHQLLEEILKISYIEKSINKIELQCQKNCNYILVAQEISPLLFLKIPKPRGLILKDGSLMDHLSLLATNQGIPILIQVFPKENFYKIHDGDWIVINTDKGKAIIKKEPPPEINLISEILPKTQKKRYTQNEVTISINADDIEIIKNHKNHYYLSVGLFRTEFLYIKDPSLIYDLNKATHTYREIFLNFDEHEILTLRLIDVNEDKYSYYLYSSPENRNKRGVEYYKSEITIIKNQIRSIFKALQDLSNINWTLRILIPMVANYEDWRFVFELILEERNHIRLESSPKIQIGIMLEIPSVFFNLHQLEKEVDFFSIGTNDLLSMFIGKHRNLISEEDIYDPSFYRMLFFTLNSLQKEIGICGAIATRLDLIPLLYYSQVRNFSVPLGLYSKIYDFFSNYDFFEKFQSEFKNLILFSKTKKEMKENLKSIFNSYFSKSNLYL
ncbi:MAG: PEP-utilizing enzyme [Leptospiraceae bacterium]|nr:PEP-utilizing enzyme [Leptospiraceae bacterium]MDW7976882.1 putative PEP-binding protein [Leptospiraceae bacterium]